MKKMTFALACASTAALFADMAPLAGFENYANDAHVADAVEPGSQSVYWLYNGASGSTDGSEVKEFGTVPGYPNVDFGEKYLNLSTEGGTLWRSINEGDTQKEGAAKLGSAQTVPADTGIYIDTMVQFTPTEDGGEPTLDPADKIAIWLNVDKDGVTNLCVRTTAIARPGYVPSSVDYAEGSWSQTEKTIVLSGEYSASTWYRLTMQAVKSVTSHADAEVIPGFIISIDGNPVTASEQLVGDDAISYLNDDGEGGLTAGWVSEDNIALIRSKKFIPSLAGLQDSGSVTLLQAVGFKGSGAIDDLSISTTAPTPEGDFEVNWGSEGVQAVWGDTPPTAAELAAIKAWAVENGLTAADVAGEKGAAAYLLGLTEVPEDMPELKITAIEQTETGWTITIACDAQSDLSKINGSLVVKTAAELGGTWTSTVVTTPAATVAVTAEGAKFMKAAIGKPVAAPAAE